MKNAAHTKSLDKDSTGISFTIRRPPCLYAHLELQPQLSKSANGQLLIPDTKLDEITLRQYLTQALTQYLGLTGSATAIDILKVEEREAWIRLAHGDQEGLIAALSQWAGKGVHLRVKGRGAWLGALVGNADTAKLWTLET